MTQPLSLVTGACGFMGTHMVEILVKAGHRVRATDLVSAFDHDDLKTGRFRSVIKNLSAQGVEWVAADLTKPNEITKLMDGVDYVFHIAAIFSYSAPWEILHRVNVQGTQNLLDLIKKTPTFKKMILWAAGGVFKFPQSPEDLPIRETSPIDPQNNYLKSKWEQECLVRNFCRENNLKFSAIMPTTVYGPRAVYGGGQMIREPLQMKTVMVPRNFTARIPTIHVRDVCRAALHLAQSDQGNGESFIVNDNSTTKTTDFMQMMARLTGKKFRLLPPIPLGFIRFNLSIAAALGKLRKKIFGGPNPKFEKDLVKYFGVDFLCDNSKLKATGFQFEYPEFEKGLENSIPWFREVYNL
ncbi:MAG: NAD(P)-dependent oxidoreductase [Deltaproteobacteria bacterium]|nr:MAG: NAD(P)-dependent oxidoreductase [Deltaproteobacteria bacterium]